MIPLQPYLPKTVRISGFLTGGFEAIWPPNWGDFAKKECVTATSRSFKPGGLAIIWTVGNNNNVGGLERNSLILYKWGLESFILYMWGASKEIPPFPIYGGIISRSPHVLHVGGFEKNLYPLYVEGWDRDPPSSICGWLINRFPLFYMWGVWKRDGLPFRKISPHSLYMGGS